MKGMRWIASIVVVLMRRVCRNDRSRQSIGMMVDAKSMLNPLHGDNRRLNAKYARNGHAKHGERLAHSVKRVCWHVSSYRQSN